MVFRVTRPEVIENLIRFKDNLSEMRDKEQEGQDQEEHSEEKKRKYKVLLNRKTGDMRFSKEIVKAGEKQGASEHSLEEFKEIEIIVSESKGRKTQFEVFENDSQAFNAHEIDPLAYRVAKETVDLLNLKSQEEPALKKSGVLPEEQLLSNLSDFELENPNDQIQNLPGWRGHMSRMDAEKDLEKDPVGSYILREADEIASQIAFHLEEENHILVHSFLLTAKEDEDKISDHLLLQTNKGWCLYKDDPDLKGSKIYHFSNTPKDLIEQIEFAKQPKR